MSTIRIKQELCSGCLNCVMACSLKHEGYASPSSARLHINLNLFEDNQIYFCRQCQNAPCSKACPEQAITRTSEDAPWLIDYGRCTNCKECISACPFNAMIWDSIRDRVIKCDLCDGEMPACMDACPTGALSIVGGGSEGGELGKAEGDRK